MAPHPAARPRSPFRSLLGLLLRGLPRGLIARRFRDLSPSGADKPVPYPVGQACPGEVRSLADQFLVFGY